VPAPHVLVIGAGFAGLSAACHLARGGARVTLLEKHDQPGGRARSHTLDGFRFDLGPSWYWMPDLFDRFFQAFDRRVEDLYELRRLDPSYTVVWPGGEPWDIPAGVPALRELFERIEPGSGAELDRFLEISGTIYRAATEDYLLRPSLSLSEFVDVRLVREVFRLRMLESMHRFARRRFRDPRLARLVEWPVLFLGASSRDTPAMYSLMAYADMALGTWYPMGGMHRIIEAMVEVARAEGVELRFGAEVEAIEVAGSRATGVRTDGRVLAADGVLAAADYHHVEQHLLPPHARQDSEATWDRRRLSPSSLLLYLGVEGRVPKLHHHTLFFDEDLDTHMDAVYQRPRWPEAPLFYVCAPSRTDPTCAPEGCENLFVLVPLAPGLRDDEAARETCAEAVLDRLEAYVGAPLPPRIRVRRTWAMRDFEREYHAYKGNAYGLANTLLQTGPFKPRLASSKVSNLAFAGQLTVPGPGMPPSLISGELGARVLLERLGARGPQAPRGPRRNQGETWGRTH
jgi:phytoene desaturase